jgi:hypothetical protein
MDGNEIAARLKFLKGADTKCPQCPSTKWATPEPNGRALLPIANGGQPEEFRPIILVCDNCGFVRLHDERKLHD